MNEPVVFNFESNQVRVITDEHGDPWWVAKDVCEILGYQNPSKTVGDHLDDDEKGVTNCYTLGGPQEMIIISESGLYTLIIRSNKLQAAPFRRWVTHEVLPAIRKTGTYSVPRLKANLEDGSANQKTVRLLKDTYKDLIEIAGLSGLEGNQAILSADQATARLLGLSPLVLIGHIHLEDPSNNAERHLTPTEIGKQMEGISAIQVNTMLMNRGFQKRYTDTKGKKRWTVTDKGKPYAILKDTGKKTGGVPIQQLFWLESVIPLLKEERHLKAV